jgi:hypothetical protein
VTHKTPYTKKEPNWGTTINDLKRTNGLSNMMMNTDIQYILAIVAFSITLF